MSGVDDSVEWPLDLLPGSAIRSHRAPQQFSPAAQLALVAVIATLVMAVGVITYALFTQTVVAS